MDKDDLPAEDGYTTELHFAVTNGATQLEFRKIFEAAEDKNPKDETGRTPLHEAAARGLIDIAKFLVDHSRLDV